MTNYWIKSLDENGKGDEWIKEHINKHFKNLDIFKSYDNLTSPPNKLLSILSNTNYANLSDTDKILYDDLTFISQNQNTWENFI